MTSCNEEIIIAIDRIKEKSVPLYQTISKKDFSLVFSKEISSLSKVLEEKGINEFKVRTSNGSFTIQTFNIASTLSYLKIHNKHLNVDNFLIDLSSPKDGYLEFGYLLSTQIDSPLYISETFEIHPFNSIEDHLSAINKSEIQKFFSIHPLSLQSVEISLLFF